jgi:hypothetical protein
VKNTVDNLLLHSAYPPLSYWIVDSQSFMTHGWSSISVGPSFCSYINRIKLFITEENRPVGPLRPTFSGFGFAAGLNQAKMTLYGQKMKLVSPLMTIFKKYRLFWTFFLQSTFDLYAFQKTVDPFGPTPPPPK